MHPRIWQLSLIVISLLMMSVPLYAQGYTPPPMFGAPADPDQNAPDQKAKDAPARNVSPAIKKTPKPVDSVKKERAKVLETVPVPQPKPVVKKEQPVKAKAIPPKATPKQITPVVEAIPAPTLVPTPATSDIAIPKRKPEPPKMVIQKPKPSKGVVTGPKTMPAVPAQSFDAEAIYKDNDGKIEGAILKRHVESVAPEPVAPKPITKDVDLTLLNIFELADGKAWKIVVPFSKGNSDISDQLQASIESKSVELLGANKSWRMRIMAYASPYDEGLSSDRRMALNRALLFRKMLLDQGIEARRIDVHAKGQNTDDPNKDRVDLIYYAPDAEM